MNNLKPKEPLMALMLSAVLIGLGQVYAGRIKRGILLFSIPLILSVAMSVYILNPTTTINIYILIPGVILLIFGVFALVDSYSCAKVYNTKNNLKRNITAGKRILLIVGIIFSLFILNPQKLINQYLKTTVAQSLKISSGTMEPTLMIGDRIFVDKAIYKKSEPKRGDIIIFKHPADPKITSVRRLVGLPQEKIEIKEGNILINNAALKTPEVLKIYYYNGGEYGQAGEATQIPADSYYVLGDNSASSKDSRYSGFVPKKYVQGKVFKIFFPFDRSGPIK